MGFFKDMIEGIKQDMEYRKERKRMYKEIRQEAQLEALRSLKPELANQLRQKELDKLSGKSRKEFFEKFAKNMDSFTTRVSNNVKDMYGNQSQNTTNKEDKKSSRTLLESNSIDYKNKLNQMLGK